MKCKFGAGALAVMADPIKYGLVGSRFRPCQEDVVAIVAGLPDDAIVVSGGAKGVDRWAETAARNRGLKVISHRPKFTKGMSSKEYVGELMARNTLIAEDADLIIAWPQEPVDPGHGGTWDTIKKARGLGKPVEIR